MKKLHHALALATIGATIAGAFAAGCGASGSDTASAADGCQTGTFRACSCLGGSNSTQACAADGSAWQPCACDDPDSGISLDGSGPKSDAATMCNDGVCSGTETCVTCPADCGTCPACTFAPTCTGASSVPSSPMALASFNNADQTMYTSGVGLADPGSAMVCSDPLLKMRISQIQIHKNGTSSGLEMFCMVQADDGQSSQLMLTADYMNLTDNNSPLIQSPAAGTFWGEAVNGVKLSQFNVTVTYTCFMVLQPGALQKALDAVAGVAGAAAGIPGNPYGWAFGIGGAAAAALAAATANGSGVAPLLNVQQTIDAGALLKLTNGYTWTIEQKGSTKADGDCGLFGSCDWDWELDVEAWGCAAPKGEQPK